RATPIRSVRSVVRRANRISRFGRQPRASGSGSPLCQPLGEDLFLGWAEVVRGVLVKAVGRVGLAVRVRGRLPAWVGAAAGSVSTGAAGRVGSWQSPGCGLSEESTVEVGSA